MNNFESDIQTIMLTSKKQICFVIGTEKSGTTWLQKLLNAHPEIVCRGEGQFVTQLIPQMDDAFNKYNQFIDGLHKKVFSEIEKFPLLEKTQQKQIEQFSILSSLSRYDEGDTIKVVAEKTPGNIRHLDKLYALFPDAKFLLIHRDLRDICVSGWHHIHRQYPGTTEPLLSYIKRITPAWLNDHKMVISFKEKNKSSLYEITYEDLLIDTQAIISPVFKWLTVSDAHDTVAQCVNDASFKTLSKGRIEGEENKNSHFRKGISGDWLNYFDLEMSEECDRLAGTTLASMGYKKSVELYIANKQSNSDTNKNVIRGNYVKSEPTNSVLPSSNPQDAKNYQKLERLIKKINKQKTNHKLWFELGLEYYQQGHIEQALESLQGALKISKNFFNAQLKIAIIFHASKQLSDAEKAYKKCIKIKPGDALAWRSYATVLKALNKNEQALDATKRSLKHKIDVPTWNMMIMLLKDLNMIDEATKQGNKLLQFKSDRAIKQADKKLNLINKPLPVFHVNKRPNNVISFSLWGKDKVYTKGAIENAILAKHLYYGWHCQFFCDHSVPREVTDELQDHGAKVKFVQDNNIFNFKAFWRFLVSDMSHIDRFVCRDADSRLNCQEVNAVDEWLQSDKPFHIMRDHAYHVELILAGMWGGVAGMLPNLRALATKDKEYTKSRWGDQLFLQKVVWPLIHDKVLIHDSYFSMPGTKPYPGHYRLPGQIHVGGANK